ncbi:transposase [Streptomyces griseofuscus]|uniref:transposase n=1 Tax=Streptomyces griseofuscus TaxID=146922 RepID=UPI0036C815F5
MAVKGCGCRKHGVSCQTWLNRAASGSDAPRCQVVSLTDAQWARIEPLLPDRRPKRGGRWRDHREVVDAIAFKFQTGTQWVHLPEKYGNWRGVYNRPAAEGADHGLRPRDLQTAQRCRAVHQPPQAVARHRHPL